MKSEAISNPLVTVADSRPVRRPRRSPGALVIGICVALVLIAIGVLPRFAKQRQLSADAHAAVNTAPLVNTVRPKVAPKTVETTLPGNVQAIDETTINARATGYIRRYYADIGSRVRKGQLLAEIESPDVDQQLIGAEADVDKSRAALGQSEADVSRLTASVAQADATKAAAEATVQQNRADVVSLQAKQLQADAAVQTAQANLDRARQALSARKSDLLRARTAVDLASKTLTRWKQLGKVNAVALQEVDEKQAAFDSAQDAVTAAQSAVDAADDDRNAATTQVTAARADAQAAASNVAAGRQRVAAAEAAVTSNLAGIAAAQANVRAGRQNVIASQAVIGSSSAAMQRYAALQAFQRIVAPFDGVITARNIDIGTLVSAGDTPGAGSDPTRTVTHNGLFGIANTATMRIQANVPQSFVGYLKDGQTADVTIQEFPGRVFPGRIFTRSGALDAGSRTMLVEVRVPNPTGELIPGMYASVRFTGKLDHPSLLIPANTLIVDSTGTRVATVTLAGLVHFQTVQISSDLGSNIEIGAGLSGSETLISDPTDDLTEGEHIQMATAPKDEPAK